jgi:CubicO group peptidase (beta-lactamase class C family)
MDFDPVKTLLQPYSDGKCPGCSLTVVHNGKPIFVYTAGYANLEDNEPVTDKTNFRLASVTKQFTAVATLLCVQEGKLSIEDTLVQFFDFPGYGKDISIHHLLTHTSGLIDYEDLIAEDSGQVSDEDVLKLLASQPAGYFLPGGRYHYSNGAYCLLRLIIEKVSGVPFPDFMKKRIFGPLGMNSTIVNEEGKTVIPNRAYGYSYIDGIPVLTDQDATSATIGDGGIYSSAADMAKWDKVFYSNIILSKAYMEKLLTPYVLTDVDNSSYGYGLFLNGISAEKIACHGGFSIGFSTGIYSVLKERLTIIFLANRTGADGSGMVKKIAEIIRRQI